MLARDHSVKVLDHGYVKLLDWMGSDEDVIVAARQSTGRSFEGWGPGQVCKYCRCRPESLAGRMPCSEQTVADSPTTEASHVWVETKGDLPLLKRLWSGGHTTPFEMVQLKIQVQAPLMVFREWQRHRTQSYSEMSARYIQMPNLHYIPDPTRVQGQSTTNRQASAGALPDDVVAAFRLRMEEEQQAIYGTYEDYLADGVSRELARLNTPVSRYSRMVASANLLNWFRFLGLRIPEDAQWEIRQYSAVVADFIKQLFPRCWDLFEEYTLFSKRLSRTDVGDARRIVGELINAMKAGGDMEAAQAQLVRLQQILAA